MKISDSVNTLNMITNRVEGLAVRFKNKTGEKPTKVIVGYSVYGDLRGINNILTTVGLLDIELSHEVESFSMSVKE
jgi:NAD-specific glutamate dehydrogenase